MRTSTIPASTRWANACSIAAQTYGLVAPTWEQAKVLAEHITGRNPRAAYHGSKVATRLKVAGVQLASMGVIEPGEEHDEVVQFAEPRKGLTRS